MADKQLPAFNPDESLEEQLTMAHNLLHNCDEDNEINVCEVVKLAVRVIELNAWIKRNGALPKPWRRSASAPAPVLKFVRQD